MDENKYAANAAINGRTLEDLIAEFEIIRTGTIYLYRHMSEAQSRFAGNNGEYPITARALGYIMPGHAQHHINVISERYL